MGGPLFANDDFLAHYYKPVRARLRGLARNPVIPAALLRRLVDEQWPETRYTLPARRRWTEEQFGALAGHPDREVRMLLAQAMHVTPEQRARLVEDPEGAVLHALAVGPDWFSVGSWTPREVLPVWAYKRLLERRPRLALWLEDCWGLPEEVRAGLAVEVPPPAATRSTAAAGAVLDRREAEERASHEKASTRADVAADPRLPADLVDRLAVDPDAEVRLAVSMRRELTEEQRAAIDYRVDRDDRIRPVSWAADAVSPDIRRRCVHSAHVGLRRSVAYNPHLTPEEIAVLARDDDFAVRLLLCEQHRVVPAETVLTTYLEARTVTRGRLLEHPSFVRAGLARLAGSPDPQARALVVLDPDAPPELIERLSHDPHPMVRNWMADDPRLTPGRVLELFEDESTAGGAAASPHLPVPLMQRALADAATLAEEPVEGTPVLYLGRWPTEES